MGNGVLPIKLHLNATVLEAHKFQMSLLNLIFRKCNFSERSDFICAPYWDPGLALAMSRFITSRHELRWTDFYTLLFFSCIASFNEHIASP